MKCTLPACVFCLALFAASTAVGRQTEQTYDLQVVTVATDETDGFLRFARSAKVFDLKLRVLGKGLQWRGGDVRRFTGGGQKVNLLHEALSELKENEDLLVMFVDSYDVIINGGAQEIIKRFLAFDADIVFSAEGFCWPDESLAESYPLIKSGKPYLNSGGFIGYAKALDDLLSAKSIKLADDDDDQLFYTKLFLDNDIRERLRIKLDTTSKLFQNLNGATDDVSLNFMPNKSEVKNTAYNTFPLVVHGNGASKTYLNYLGNYLASYWTTDGGCLACAQTTAELSENEAEWPTVTLAVLIEKKVPFMEEFLERLAALHYPKDRMVLFVHNKEVYHTKDVEQFLRKWKTLYREAHVFDSSDAIEEREARMKALKVAVDAKCDFVFVVEADAQLTNVDTLKLLVERNRPIVAPLLSRPAKLWTNFWGAVNDDGFYARSDDYVELVQRTRKGLWNVPCVNTVYLMSASRLTALLDAFDYNEQADADMSFCQFCRDHGIFMFLDNVHHFGHLINADYFETTHFHNELYQIFDNRLDWESRYIHENYSQVLREDYAIESPCPDVYWFPVVSEKFCWELIEEVEHFGQWSDGTNKDPRLAGGYENVPTVDIHLNQVGLERTWLHFLDEFVRAVQEKVFTGYYHVPPSANMNFVVRYRPGEQDHLRPHHDASTYSINLALNRAGIDFEGGGSRFIRQNCTAAPIPRPGWALMHPGRLTHFHEGLRTTKGTRYIMVSFVDP